jgi:hypothetical protein
MGYKYANQLRLKTKITLLSKCGIRNHSVYHKQKPYFITCGDVSQTVWINNCIKELSIYPSVITILHFSVILHTMWWQAHCTFRSFEGGVTTAKLHEKQSAAYMPPCCYHICTRNCQTYKYFYSYTFCFWTLSVMLFLCFEDQILSLPPGETHSVWPSW